MKKIFLFILLTICLLGFSTTAETPFMNVSLEADTDYILYRGDVIECRINYTDIDSIGLSSVELFIDFSDGLRYNSDATATGLSEEWSLWPPSMDNGLLKIGVVDDSAVTPGVSDFEIKFSFTVVSDSFSNEYVKIAEHYAYDFDINSVENVGGNISAIEFAVNVPQAKVENLGASLRINNVPAIRFGMKCLTLPENAECGILVIESAKLDGELTATSEGVIILDADIKLSDDVLTTEAFEITSSNTKYTFRPFAILKTFDGENFVVYFDTLERSAEDIAKMSLETETDSTKRTLLEAFCTST